MHRLASQVPNDLLVNIFIGAVPSKHSYLHEQGLLNMHRFPTSVEEALEQLDYRHRTRQILLYEGAGPSD